MKYLHRAVYAVMAGAIKFDAVSAQDTLGKEVSMSWSAYLTQDFYHMWLIPLSLITVVLAWLARPSYGDERPANFRHFQISYLVVWSFCVAADWLQGPYVYALYAAYGFESHQIAQLFVAGFGSSMIFGCFVGSVADKFGRKKMCIGYCILYIISCLTKHVNQYSVLMLGRVTGGIATSMLFSCFECWMVSEHMQRNRFSGGLLSYMFGLMFTLMYCVAILSGLAGQLAADSVKFHPISAESHIWVGGYTMPFDLSILCLVIGLVLIVVLWEENYGTQAGMDSGSLMGNIHLTTTLLFNDMRMLLLGILVASFEGSMFAFVFNWTPALDSKTVPPPHGIIFSMFMMACMCGASSSTLLGNMASPATRLKAAFVTGIGAFALASNVSGSSSSTLMVSFLSFLVFEYCVGLYFPSIGVIKSDIVPERLRGTMYNMFRIPLNAIVVSLLLSSFSLATCFKLCAALLCIAFVAMCGVMNLPASDMSKSVDFEVPKAV